MREKMETVGIKSANIDRKGKKALSRAEVNPFKHSPEENQRRFNVAVRFEEPSVAEFQGRVIAELEEAEKQFGIKLLIAGRDFPLHSTILEGRSEAPAEEKERLFTDVNAQVQDQLASSLKGQDIDFKYLLIDKGNLLMTSMDIPESVLAARQTLTQTYAQNGLKPLPITNLLHFTVARMTELPADPEIFKRYKDAMIKLRHSISGNPLHMRISEIYSGSTYDLLNPNESAQD
jgi:hypothetical protein